LVYSIFGQDGQNNTKYYKRYECRSLYLNNVDSSYSRYIGKRSDVLWGQSQYIFVGRQIANGTCVQLNAGVQVERQACAIVHCAQLNAKPGAKSVIAIWR